jgi:hypothetical protein
MQSGKLRVREERAKRWGYWGFIEGSAQRGCYALPPGEGCSYGELGRAGRTTGALYSVGNWNACGSI